MLDNKLIIDIPKGMEVDIEKSDLKAGSRRDPSAMRMLYLL